jgi:hypothetical protein
MTICVGPFAGYGGEACVDFAPIDHVGREIATERRDMRTQKVAAGCEFILKPEGIWIVGGN